MAIRTLRDVLSEVGCDPFIRARLEHILEYLVANSRVSAFALG